MTTAALFRRSLRAWISEGEEDRGPAWLQWLWTLLLSVGVGALFTLLNVAPRFGRGLTWGHVAQAAWVNWGISVTVCVLIHLEFALVRAWLGRAWMRSLRGLRATLFYASLPLLGVLVGWPLGVTWTLGPEGWRWLDRMPTGVLVASLVMAIGITVALHVFFSAKARQFEAEARSSEARLRLLQAQIEPHFLFNTLANVVALMERDPATARTMLESFIDYLRASLSGLGREDHSLGDEMRLVDAYLAIAGLRMAGRLAVEIDVPAALRTTPLPALVLQPLVENAIVHGLEPRIEGGRVRVRGRADGDRLELVVEDDGLGLATLERTDAHPPRRTDSGTALANIRDRLAMLFGGRATLDVVAGEPRGTRAVLRLPLAAGVAA